jgi:serine/threonine protein kinase
MDKGSLLDVLQTDRAHFPSTPKKEKHVLLRNREENHVVDLELSALSKGMPERIVASVAYQILWGVAFLHFENSIHRDIKPANILVNSLGEVKLSDFGISAMREPGEALNRTVVGTTLYMSPERLRAKPYGTPSDIWSVGLVLLECLTGQSPFFGISSVVRTVCG